MSDDALFDPAATEEAVEDDVPPPLGDDEVDAAEEDALGWLPIFAAAHNSTRPTIEDYCRASAEYIRDAPGQTAGRQKSGQIALSRLLGRVHLLDLEDALGRPLPNVEVGERTIGGGMHRVKADLSEVSPIEGLVLGVELKPIHLAVGRARANRIKDVREFAVNVHLKFPFAVVGGVMSLPTFDRVRSSADADWRSTADLVDRTVEHFKRAIGRRDEGDPPHRMEGMAVVVFDPHTGEMSGDVPAAGSGLRWSEYIEALAHAYDDRFGAT